jgi:hypothetical protein
MTDISKCSGERNSLPCPIRETCRRYLARSGLNQSWLREAPFMVAYDTSDSNINVHSPDWPYPKNVRVECPMYWPQPPFADGKCVSYATA